MPGEDMRECLVQIRNAADWRCGSDGPASAHLLLRGALRRAEGLYPSVSPHRVIAVILLNAARTRLVLGYSSIASTSVRHLLVQLCHAIQRPYLRWGQWARG